MGTAPDGLEMTGVLAFLGESGSFVHIFVVDFGWVFGLVAFLVQVGKETSLATHYRIPPHLCTVAKTPAPDNCAFGRVIPLMKWFNLLRSRPDINNMTLIRDL